MKAKVSILGALIFASSILSAAEVRFNDNATVWENAENWGGGRFLLVATSQSSVAVFVKFRWRKTPLPMLD